MLALSLISEMEELVQYDFILLFKNYDFIFISRALIQFKLILLVLFVYFLTISTYWLIAPPYLLKRLYVIGNKKFRWMKCICILRF